MSPAKIFVSEKLTFDLFAVVKCYADLPTYGFLDYSVLDISKLQFELRNNDKVRRLLRLYHLLDNQQQLQKWQRFIGRSSTSRSGTFYLLVSLLCPARSI